MDTNVWEHEFDELPATWIVCHNIIFDSPCSPTPPMRTLGIPCPRNQSSKSGPSLYVASAALFEANSPLGCLLFLVFASHIGDCLAGHIPWRRDCLAQGLYCSGRMLQVHGITLHAKAIHPQSCGTWQRILVVGVKLGAPRVCDYALALLRSIRLSASHF